MPNGFATEEFLRFSSSNAQNILSVGICNVDHLEPFPYQIIKKAKSSITENQNFLVSPICFSGATQFDVSVDIDRIMLALQKEKLAGGFIQTRALAEQKESFIETELCYVYLDTRTNYRLPLGRNDEELLGHMKPDSRSRSRKLLKSAAEYEVSEVNSNVPSTSIKQFAELYRQAAMRLEFSAVYQFSEVDFEKLLSSTLWTLYQLHRDGVLVAGSLVCKVEGGYDYTFMASSVDAQDSGRANLLFLYRYLSEQSKSFLDLGGGIKEGDPLSRFKLGFGAEPYEFLRLKFVSKSSIGSATEDEIIHALSGYWP